MLKKKKTTASGKLVLVKSVRRTRSHRMKSVSYTHLDVYKRQVYHCQPQDCGGNGQPVRL